MSSSSSLPLSSPNSSSQSTSNRSCCGGRKTSLLLWTCVAILCLRQGLLTFTQSNPYFDIQIIARARGDNISESQFYETSDASPLNDDGGRKIIDDLDVYGQHKAEPSISGTAITNRTATTTRSRGGGREGNINGKQYPLTPDAAQHQQQQQRPQDKLPRRKIYLGGILDDGQSIKQHGLQFLIEMGCTYGIPMLVLVRRNAAELQQIYQTELQKIQSSSNSNMCVEQPSSSSSPLMFQVKNQPDYISEVTNRIDRISLVRDYEREELKQFIYNERDQLNNEGTENEDAVVVLADLDLLELPSPQDIIKHAQHSIRRNDDGIENDNGKEDDVTDHHHHHHQLDVLCSAGTYKKHDYSEEAYYNTFATILLPDTFTYSLKMRYYNESIRPVEDPNLIISTSFTEKSLYQWIQKEGTPSTSSGTSDGMMNPVPVRSCFGGLAMYRASIWLDETCRYSSQLESNHESLSSSPLAVYANDRDHRACEHVAFNECLRRNHPTLQIAIQPDMKTRWGQHMEQKPIAPIEQGVYMKNGKLIRTSLLPQALDPSFHGGGGKNVTISESLVSLQSYLDISFDTVTWVSRNETPKINSNGGDEDEQGDKRQKEAPRPRAVIHIGPHKTGTTAIQSSMVRYHKQLKKDGYDVLSRGMYFGHCLMDRDIDVEPVDWEGMCHNAKAGALYRQMEQAMRRRRNVIVSSESMSRVKHVIPAKLEQFFPNYDIDVVSTYRRFFEWMVSLYGQVYHKGGEAGVDAGWGSWPATGNNGRKAPAYRNVVDFLSKENIDATLAKLYTTSAYRWYEEHSKYNREHYRLRLLNYHQTDNMVETFFCSLTEEDIGTCLAVQSDFAKEEGHEDHNGMVRNDIPIRTNTGIDTFFDEIVVAAFYREMIPTPVTDIVSRPRARKEFEMFWLTHQAELNITKSSPTSSGAGSTEQEEQQQYNNDQDALTEYPRICVSDDIFNHLKNISLEAEASLVPEFFNSPDGKPALLHRLDEYKTTKFCTVDTDKVLDHPLVRTFFIEKWSSIASALSSEESESSSQPLSSPDDTATEQPPPSIQQDFYRRGTMKKGMALGNTTDFTFKVTSSSSNQPPDMAWLMSFPNSGTSYTLAMIESITGQAMASNYGKETVHASQPRMLVYDDQPEGPFWLSDPTSNPPNRYITHDNDNSKNNNNNTIEDQPAKQFVLTKTHCGARCTGCSPSKFIASADNFIHECAIENRRSPSYSTKRTKKAIHLIRDPYDNAVARFHMLRNTGRLDDSNSSSNNKNNDEEMTPTDAYKAGRQAFRDYCLNDHDIQEENRELMVALLTEEQLVLMDGIPCGTDIVRYAVWHNKAFESIQEMGLETLNIHYDSYETDFDGTTSKILNFLGFQKVNDPVPFVPGKVYKNYYTPEERSKVATFIRSFASEQTWSEVSPYLGFVEEDNESSLSPVQRRK